MLLSGSQDGYMKLFVSVFIAVPCCWIGLRSIRTLLRFLQDLRKRDVSSSFYARDGVRDIQYNPAHYFTFAAALENGNIQVLSSSHSPTNELDTETSLDVAKCFFLLSVLADLGHEKH